MSFLVHKAFSLKGFEPSLLGCFYRYQKRVSNIIDDVLEWSPRLALSSMMDKQPVVNVTDSNNVTDATHEAMDATEGETVADEIRNEDGHDHY